MGTGVAIIGCGWAGARHARAFLEEDARVLWAIDTREDRANAVAPSGSRVSSDYREALASREVDAVAVCLPHHLHAPVALDALRAGKHVLVEKPLASTLEEADAMIAAAEEANRVLMVAENALFDTRLMHVHDLLRQGLIGRPAFVQMTRQAYLRRSFLEERRWFLDAHAAAGGIMMSGGIHDFAKMLMLIGDIDRVFAQRAPQRFLEMGGDDTSVAMVRFKDGSTGVLVESFIMKELTTSSGPEIHTLRIDGELGSIRMPDSDCAILFSEREDQLLEGAPCERVFRLQAGDSFRAEVRDFLRCAATGARSRADGRAMRRPLELVLAAYRSMETGEPVPV